MPDITQGVMPGPSTPQNPVDFDELLKRQAAAQALAKQQINVQGAPQGAINVMGQAPAAPPQGAMPDMLGPALAQQSQAAALANQRINVQGPAPNVTVSGPAPAPDITQHQDWRLGQMAPMPADSRTYVPTNSGTSQAELDTIPAGQMRVYQGGRVQLLDAMNAGLQKPTQIEQMNDMGRALLGRDPIGPAERLAALNKVQGQQKQDLDAQLKREEFQKDRDVANIQIGGKGTSKVEQIVFNTTEEGKANNWPPAVTNAVMHERAEALGLTKELVRHLGGGAAQAQGAQPDSGTAAPAAVGNWTPASSARAVIDSVGHVQDTVGAAGEKAKQAALAAEADAILQKLAPQFIDPATTKLKPDADILNLLNANAQALKVPGRMRGLAAEIGSRAGGTGVLGQHIAAMLGDRMRTTGTNSVGGFNMQLKPGTTPDTSWWHPTDIYQLTHPELGTRADLAYSVPNQMFSTNPMFRQQKTLDQMQNEMPMLAELLKGIGQVHDRTAGAK